MSSDQIIWEGVSPEDERLRVVKPPDAKGPDDFVVEVAHVDALKKTGWITTDDRGQTNDAAWLTVWALAKELEELRRRASAREVLPDLRERTSVELADALGVDVTTRWPVLLDKVRDLAVTDCAPASQAEQMLWQVRDALGEYPSRTRPTTWSGMLDEVRTLANPEGVPAKSELHEGATARPKCGDRLEGVGTTRADDPICALPAGHVGKHSNEEHATGKGWRWLTGQTMGNAPDLASLRAKLTALGKHVEDVERRAYDTASKQDFHRAHERIGKIEDRVCVVEDTTAGKAETLEAVRSLTDALQALRQEMTTSWKTAVTQNELTDALTELNAKVDDLAAGWGSCGPARPDEKREAVIREHEAGYREAPLDLATLRVSGQATGASENAVSFRPAGHALDIVVAVRVLPEYGGEERCEWATVDPHSARIIARALTQWADGAEKGAGK